MYDSSSCKKDNSEQIPAMNPAKPASYNYIFNGLSEVKKILAFLDLNRDISQCLLKNFSQMKTDWRIKHSSHNSSISIIYLWVILQNTQCIFSYLFPCMHFEPSGIVNTACIIS